MIAEELDREVLEARLLERCKRALLRTLQDADQETLSRALEEEDVRGTWLVLLGETYGPNEDGQTSGTESGSER